MHEAGWKLPAEYMHTTADTSAGTPCLPYVFVGDPHYKRMEPIGLPAKL